MGTILRASEVDEEIDRLVRLLATEIGDHPAFVLVSGGLDSDVVARLTVRAVGASRMKVATVLQDEMENRHLAQARALAEEISIDLVELDMRGTNLAVVYRLAAGDSQEGFNPLGLLDPARMKCSLRTVVTSSYQDRGYIIVGTSNRTEVDLGFFLPFGDGIWHVGPIAHLYKTEVRLIAAALGTSAAVLAQPPSAGFWYGQTDREDIGFWLVNRGPIQRARDFADEEVARANGFSERLNEADLDQLLLTLREGGDTTDLPVPVDIVAAVTAVVEQSAHLKNRRMGVALSRRA